MKNIRFLVALATIAGMTTLLSAQATAASADADATRQKVVYHINYDDPKLQTAALRNVQNHINAVGAENLDIKVVLHGNGLACCSIRIRWRAYPSSNTPTPRTT